MKERRYVAYAIDEIDFMGIFCDALEDSSHGF